MSVLNHVVLVRHLSHLQVIYHETGNIQHIVFATSRLMESDLELRARIMAGPLPGTYMEALLMLSTVLNAESLQELHGRRFEGLPPPPGRSPQNEIDLKAVLPILEQIIGWNMSTSGGIPGGVKQLIVNGAIKILGHSVHLRHGDEKHAALLDHLFAVLDEYAVYPKIITVLEAAVKADLETRLGRPEKDHRKVREFARSTKDTKLVGLAYAHPYNMSRRRIGSLYATTSSTAIAPTLPQNLRGKCVGAVIRSSIVLVSASWKTGTPSTDMNARRCISPTSPGKLRTAVTLRELEPTRQA
ncbi:hypothetical protein FA13DRAFT_1111536 [Coprinellus micaceus]|uniref:Uncharacterized protein n=1 Tax=Coprinellus micaceus TaxID=71717 RepID=A0A4Y7SW91_COPMI|nr:hypothetical protein FA13DRAFT_1111536 [Coprinellus micaceus]